MKTGTHKTMKEYLERIWDEKIELQIKYKKTKELGWKENHTIQITGNKNPQEDIRVDQKLVMKLCENYFTGLYDRPIKESRR
jgi:hypothetical protein